MNTPSEQSINVAERSLSVHPDHAQPLSLPPMLITVAAISLFLTATVGSALFFFPEIIQARWVWPLTPYNTRFLGAIYLAAAVGFTSLLTGRRSALARLIVPMIFVFTTNALIVSCLQLQQFNAGRRASDLWFLVYIIDCVGSGYFWGYYRHHVFAGLRRLSKLWSVGLGVQAGLMGAYGLSLLFFPETTGGQWLWPLDVFHSQIYSSILLSGAVGAAMLSRRATVGELRALGTIQLVFSGLVILGVGMVDRTMQGIDWSLALNWVWMGAIALLGISGLGLIGQSKKLT
ncbi:MAG: hypothetical protein AAF703_16340 [Cyanobacteria bacterium P01_D01_bin.105]